MWDEKAVLSFEVQRSGVLAMAKDSKKEGKTERKKNRGEEGTRAMRAKEGW